MPVLVEAFVDVIDIVSNLNQDTARELILAADLQIADYEFTVSIVQHLIAALREECAVDGEELDMSMFAP